LVEPSKLRRDDTDCAESKAMPQRVLVVEDDPDNQDLVAIILQRAGYEVLRANNGSEGIEMARRCLPDLILMDLSMPDMDGWAATRLIKADPATSAIPVVALTVRNTAEDKLRAVQAGFDGYLTKPMNVKNFVRQVAHFVEPPGDY